MKKLTLLSFLMLVTVQLTFAQASQVMAAYNYLDEYKLGKDGSDLLEAKEAIDKASAHETTGLQGKTWYYKGLIYSLLSKDELLSKADDTYITTALESFEKSVTLNDKKFRDKNASLDNMRAISGDIFNSGVDAYQNENFEKAYNYFYAMKAINKTLDKYDIESVVPTERTVTNAASAAESAGMNEEAIAAYKDLITINNEVNNYRFLANLYKRTGDKENGLATLEEASKAHPESAEVIIDQLNYYIEDGKLTEAIDKLDKAIELQPENDMLYFVKGNAYDRNGDVEEAIIQYEKAIAINPENDKALYNAGAMYFLGANKYIEEMNELNYNETKKYDELDAKRQEMYLKAKPYFEKVLEINPEDDASEKALFKINRALDK